MNLIDRLKAFLGINTVSTDNTNIVTDDIWEKFFSDIQHTEGNAVEVHLAPGMFTQDQIGELLQDDLIYYHYSTEDGVIVLLTDKDRLARFDIDVLKYLELQEIAQAPSKAWWEE